jgi:hypothetical protein
MIAEYKDDRVLHGAAAGLGTARAWRDTANVAEKAALMEPVSRMTAATAQINMLEEAELRTAGMALMEALGALMASANKPKSCGLRAGRQAAQRGASQDR